MDNAVSFRALHPLLQQLGKYCDVFSVRVTVPVHRDVPVRDRLGSHRPVHRYPHDRIPYCPTESYAHCARETTRADDRR